MLSQNTRKKLLFGKQTEIKQQMHENFHFCSLKQKIARFDSIDRIKLRLLCIGTV